MGGTDDTSISNCKKTINAEIVKRCWVIECQETEASILLPGDRVLVRNMSERGGTGKLRLFWDNKIHIVLETYGENPVLFRIQAENDPNGRRKNLHRSNHVMTWWTFSTGIWQKKDKRKAESIVGNKTKKVKAEKAEKEIQEESSEDELSQFTLARMRPLIDDIRLLDRRTTSNNDQ